MTYFLAPSSHKEKRVCILIKVLRIPIWGCIGYLSNPEPTPELRPDEAQLNKLNLGSCR